MNLTTEFQDLVRKFFASEATLYDLNEWLTDHVQSVANLSDLLLDDATAYAWLVWCDFDEGMIDQDEARRVLARNLERLDLTAQRQTVRSTAQASPLIDVPRSLNTAPSQQHETSAITGTSSILFIPGLHRPQAPSPAQLAALRTVRV
jgi:hypothetical protein